MLEKVTERIYYLMNEDKNERPALGLVKGDKCCLVIDAGNSTKHAEMFLNEIKGMNLPPIAYVVATHHHWDHIFGLEVFDSVKVGSHKTYELSKIYCQGKLDEKSIEEIKFDLLFTGKLEIDLGGVSCLVKEIINPHRDDGTIIYVPQEKTLFLGDSAYGRIKDGRSFFDIEKLTSMMKEVNSYEADYYLCSHESICSREEIEWYFDKLNMGLEITGGLNKTEDIIKKFKEVYNNEPSEEDLFFLQSIYE